MTQLPALSLSTDQTAAMDRLWAMLRDAGVDPAAGTLAPPTEAASPPLAVLGRAGSGKTMLLAELTRSLIDAGVELVRADWEGRKRRDRRTLAVLAPTNKAASVLRGRGVPATTIHRILYTPVYDPQYERIAAWLAGEGSRPPAADLPEGMTDAQLDRAAAFHAQVASVPGALAAAGLRGADFIKGWKRRSEPLDIGFVDEASMLDTRAFDDLREVFPRLVLFGDPAQLAPVGDAGAMVFDRLAAPQRLTLARIHRQAAGNPILDLAHALGDTALEFEDFEEMVAAAARDDRVVLATRVEAGPMARAPVLVWRNATRIRLIQAFRAAHNAPEDRLLPGEPLICDGLELPLKHRKRRIELEARGLIKGAQAVYLGPGSRDGFSRIHVMGAEEPQISVASIVKIERPGEDEEPFIPHAARMGAVFLHGAAVTIHKAQGSQWPEVQVFAPDIRAAAFSGRTEAGIALWKRLAYVAITRAQHRLHWVTRYRLGLPSEPLSVADLRSTPAPLALAAGDGAD